MTVLTININDKKDRKALKAVKAVLDGFDLDYNVGHAANSEVVSIPVAEWQEILKRLNTEDLYKEFEESVKAIKGDINGISSLPNARELLNGH